MRAPPFCICTIITITVITVITGCVSRSLARAHETLMTMTLTTSMTTAARTMPSTDADVSP